MPADTTMVLKSFGGWVVKDAERGEVEAVVGNINVVDKDGDVFLPGSIPESKVKLSDYRHSIILGGSPPAGIGTARESGDDIVVRGRFFMSTERGREAFFTVQELGPDGEWSVGFSEREVKTAPMTDEWRAKGARRLIAHVPLVEASPVFRGAAMRSGTVSAKAESLNVRMEAVHNALWARNEGMDIDDHWYAREVFDEFVIVSAGSKLLRVAYTMDDDGTVALGEAEEVEVRYVPVAAAGEEETKGAPDDDAAASEVAHAEFLRLSRSTETLEAVDARIEADEAADRASRLQTKLARRRADEEVEQKAITTELARFQATARRLGVA